MPSPTPTFSTKQRIGLAVFGALAIVSAAFLFWKGFESTKTEQRFDRRGLAAQVITKNDDRLDTFATTIGSLGVALVAAAIGISLGVGSAKVDSYDDKSKREH
jgi:hypothetical protein